MIEFVPSGNLLEAQAEALVNTVNTEGVMGKGIALQFKRAFPLNYKAYRAACASGDVQIGRMFVTETGALEPRLIINFPTKRHWRSKSRLEDIETGLQSLRRTLVEEKITSVAIPPLGCGLGGLAWRDVRPRIEAALRDLDVQVSIFEPGGTPTSESMIERRERPRMTPGRSAFIGILSRYLMPGDVASPLVVQKLLYFLQEAGEPLKLDFAKGKYGPYADQVRHAIAAMEGHFVTGYGDGTGHRDIQLMPGAVAEAQPFLAQHQATSAHLDRVVELIRGFESPYGLELLATAHWVATRENASDAATTVQLVQAWSSRKKGLFTEPHVVSAWRRLRDAGWTTATA